MTINKITDNQRLEELTEWCRNKPEDAAIRIIVAEGFGVEPMGAPANFKVGDRVICTESHGQQYTIMKDSEWIVSRLCNPFVLLRGKAGMKVYADPEKLKKTDALLEPEDSEDRLSSFLGAHFKGEPVEGMEYSGIQIAMASEDVGIEAVISIGDLEDLLRQGAMVYAEVASDGRIKVRMLRARGGA